MIAYFDAQGRYAWVGTPTVVVDGAPPPMPHPLHATHSLYAGFADQQSQYHDVVKNIPVAIPVSPSPHHQFDYASKTWRDPRTASTQWPMVRAERDDKLTASDWVRLKAMDLGAPVPDAWLAYRQALRDVTLQADPFNIV